VFVYFYYVLFFCTLGSKDPIWIWIIIAKLLWILRQWGVLVYGHDIADSWLLKDDTEANEVMESGSVGNDLKSFDLKL